MEKVVLCEPLRTAVGGFGGTLKDLTSVQLGTAVVKEIINKSSIDPSAIDDCIFGNILPGSGPNPSRQIAIHAGMRIQTPAVTINRMCGSGLQSVIYAAQAIKSEDCACVLAGGTESMSQAPYYLDKARWGYRMGTPKNGLSDSMISDGLWDIFNDYHMGVTAENLAEKYSISKQQQDEFAYSSQMKAKSALENKSFDNQIVPIEIPKRKGDPVVFKMDEHPRPDITLEQISKLKPAFKKDGTVTAANSSGINDGAAAVLIASETASKNLGLKPLATIKSYALTGVDPSIMGIGPVSAMQAALDKAGLSLEDIDLVELNEAFAGQALAVLSDFPVPDEKLNVNGGAIALGHPIGATGAILLVKLLHELERRESSRYGMVSLCIGGGMGIAMVVEKY